MATEESMLSMVVSTSELANNIDLSNIQLFPANPDGIRQYGVHFSHPLVSPEGVQTDDSVNIHPEDPKQPSGLSGTAMGVPVVVLKSKGVLDAERSMDDTTPKKAISMDETDFRGLEPQKPTAHDDSALGKSRSTTGPRRRGRPPPMPIFTRNRTEENTASIDLKSSPAAKFVVQVMPWELQPSLSTPYAPAAVPFKWEEAPGKPKPEPPPPPAQTAADPEDPYDRRDAEGMGSPRRGCRAKASAFMGARGNSKTADCVMKSSEPCDPSGGRSRELLMAGEGLWETRKDGENAQSLNARIAAAMDVKLYDDATPAGAPNLRCRRITAPPIPSPPRDYAGKPPEKNRRRKWMVRIRKLRRPSRFFRAFFKALWRAVSCRNARHRQQGTLKLSYQYQSLSGPDVV